MCTAPPGPGQTLTPLPGGREPGRKATGKGCGERNRDQGWLTVLAGQCLEECCRATDLMGYGRSRRRREDCHPLEASLGTMVSQPDLDGSRQSSILGTPSLSVQWEIDPERCSSCQLLSASALDTHFPIISSQKGQSGSLDLTPGPCCRLACPPRQEWSACPSGLARPWLDWHDPLSRRVSASS